MADAGYLTIGKVVKRLRPQYPDLSISKVRYLEDEGLLSKLFSLEVDNSFVNVLADYLSGKSLSSR